MAEKSKHKTPSENKHQRRESRSDDNLNNNPSQFQQFLVYGWDLLGVLLAASGLIILLGLVGVTSGTVITPLVNLLIRWLGLGRFIIVLVMFAIGILLVRWRKQPPEKLSLSRVISFELSFFILLGLFSIIGGSSIAEAEAGVDPGGIIGWGIAELVRAAVGPTAGLIVLLIVLGFLFFIGFGLNIQVEQLLEGKDSSETSQVKPRVMSQQSDRSLKTEVKKQKQKTPQDKDSSSDQLSEAYQKTFESPMMTDEQPEQPFERPQTLPPLDLLNKGEVYKPDKRSINLTAGLIEKTLDEFGIPAKVVGYRSGPTVTQFAVEPGYIDKSEDARQKIRVSQISSLQRDLALALSAERLRIEAPVPGKSYVGVEIPNSKSTDVQLRPLIESEAFYRINSPLALALGRDVSGRPVIADLATMPHLLIAGTTGSGKSVCITALTACLVMNNSPEDLMLAMIDPKRVELNRFNGLPHLMGEVETEIERILGVLRWATTEMDYRYKLLQKAAARNIDAYNLKMSRQKKRKLPKIVIIIDELADLMMSAPDQTEYAVIRLAQKARAIGIHLILATQRPSTDVVTGVIKANFPTRISFAVASSIDSRVILDTGGAESLLGKGDLLFLHPEIGLPLRAQGAIVSDKELNKIIKWWKTEKESLTKVDTSPDEDSEDPPWEDAVGALDDEHQEDDLLLEDAITLINKEGHASASYFQRQLRIGYPRAARLIDQLEEMGVIGPSQGGGREREILISRDDNIDDFDLDQDDV